MESHLGDVIGEPLVPMRMPYRRRYEAADWIVNIKNFVAATAGVTFWAALLTALLLSMLLAVKPALAQPDSEQVRSDCERDAVRYCFSHVTRYIASQSDVNRRAIIACMLQNRDKLQPKCRRHLY